MMKESYGLKSSTVEVAYFNHIDAMMLSNIVGSYVTRKWKEELDALARVVGKEDSVMSCLCSMLHTQKDYGISTQNEEDLRLREAVFGANRFLSRKPTSFWALLYSASKDFVLRILMLSGLVSLGLSFVSDEDSRIEWVDGIAIFLAVLIVLLVTASNDYLKERQFSTLNKRREMFCTVIRDGRTLRINAENLYVGDILFVEVGDEILADCLVLFSQQLTLDESCMTGEPDGVRKESYEECVRQSERLNEAYITLHHSGKSHRFIPSPVALSGSIVMDGSGVLLVIAVGVHSEGGQLINKLVVDTSPTSLQNKLNTLARDIGTVGFTAAVVTFFIFLIQFWVNYRADLEFRNSLTMKTIVNRHVKFLVQAITILVVAVPEGLPLAVTLSLAFSIRRMLKDQNYVRRLAACETMGSASEILLDKTGTLTKNCMSVELVWTGSFPSTIVQNIQPDSLKDFPGLLTRSEALQKEHMSEMYRNLLVHSIAVNSTAALEFNQIPTVNNSVEHVKTVGSPTEGALFLLLRAMNWDYESVRREFRNDCKTVHCVPFSSARKLMTTVVKHPNNSELYRIYVKGGADVVFNLCHAVLDTQGHEKILTDREKKWVEHQVIRNMTCQGLRVVCICYKDLNPSLEKDWKDIAKTSDPRYSRFLSHKPSTVSTDLNPISLDSQVKIDFYYMELGLTCLAIVGIRDPVRDEVPAAVRRCQQAGIRVRMVTGDNIDTAKQIAIECNIYSPEKGGMALTGAEFYRRIGGVVCELCRTEVCSCPVYDTEGKSSAPALVNSAQQCHSMMHSSQDISFIQVPYIMSSSQQLNVHGHSNLYTVDALESQKYDHDEASMPHKKQVLSSSVDIPEMDKEQRRLRKPFKINCLAFKKCLKPFKFHLKIKIKEQVLPRRDVIFDMVEFSRIVKNLDVLARSQPLDKYAMVVGLKSMGAIVAVTGDGTNDAPALKKADIGFAMGISGKEVAKQAADIVILDDNFESIVKAIKWGRSIYDNVRKFLLFQLTVNIVAVCTALIGSILIGESPLNAVQLLWVNLIMDSFASLALATEPASDNLLDRPHSSHEYLINRLMTRNIAGQVLYQLTVMVLLIFTGECWIPEQASSYAAFEGVNGFSQFSKTCGGGRTVTPGRSFLVFSQKELYLRSWTAMIGPSRHFTVVFNTFVCLQIVNLWNARRIDNQWNVCIEAFSSSLWWIVLGIISVTQAILVQFGGTALGCHKEGLTFVQWLICIAIALGGLPVGFLLRLIPAEQLTFIPQAGNKETNILEESRNVAMVSRGRISTHRLSSRMAAGLHNQTSSQSYCKPLKGKH